MGHENSITVRAGADRFINIPSVVGGMQVSNEEAEKAYLMGQTEALSDAQGNSTWTNIEDAVSAAKARSEDTDPSNYAEGGLIAAPEGTEYLREKLYQGEDDYFKDNPNVAGMAAEDNKVILNPYSKNSKEEQGAVYSNELSRIAMRVSKDKPTFALTPEQVEQFRGTAYEGNDDAMRQTIASRIYSNDPSAGRPTDEQMQYADKLKGMVTMIQNNKKTNYAEGGMIDPISGNEVPPGALPQEVRDDIPINVSEGEFIFPANAVRFFGVGKLEGMVQSANKKLEEMEAGGRMGGEAPLGNNFAEGGAVKAFTSKTQVIPFNNPETGRSILVTFFDGKPIFQIPEGFVQGARQVEDEVVAAPTPEAVSESVAPVSNPQSTLRRKIIEQLGDGYGGGDFVAGGGSSDLTDAQASFAPGKDADGQMTGMDLYSGDDADVMDTAMDAYQADQTQKANDAFSTAKASAIGSLGVAAGAALKGAYNQSNANEIENMRGNPIDGYPDLPTTTMGVVGNYLSGTPTRAINTIKEAANTLVSIKNQTQNLLGGNPKTDKEREEQNRINQEQNDRLTAEADARGAAISWDRNLNLGVDYFDFDEPSDIITSDDPGDTNVGGGSGNDNLSDTSPGGQNWGGGSQYSDSSSSVGNSATSQDHGGGNTYSSDFASGGLVKRRKRWK